MKVSVLMITYNGQKFIEAQIESILTQGYPIHRFLVFDDCSTDGTVKILKKYHEKGKLNYVVNDKNLGVVNNLKSAITHFEDDEYIALADQDDVWYPEKLKFLAQEMTQLEAGNNATPCLVYSDLSVIDSDGNKVSDSFWKVCNVALFRHSLETLCLVNFVTGCATLINPALAAYMNTVPNEKKILHDEWLAFIAFGFGKTAKINTRLLAHRQHASSVTFSTQVEKNGLMQKVRRFQKEWIHNDTFLMDRITICRTFLETFQDNLPDKNRKTLNRILDLKNRSFILKYLYVKFVFTKAFLPKCHENRRNRPS